MTPGEKREGQRIIDIFRQGRKDEALRLLMQLWELEARYRQGEDITRLLGYTGEAIETAYELQVYVRRTPYSQVNTERY